MAGGRPPAMTVVLALTFMQELIMTSVKSGKFLILAAAGLFGVPLVSCGKEQSVFVGLWVPSILSVAPW
jgi:hypothetical protein